MWQERLNEFVVLLLVINPFEILPSFLAVTGSLDGRTRARLAALATMIAFVVLVFFLFAGGFLLKEMHVPIRAFQIAGGVVLFLVALDMIRGNDHSAGTDISTYGMKLAVYPIAIPKIAGPGAILAVTVLTDDDRFNLAEQMATAMTLALVLVVVFLMLLASPITWIIGATGARVIGRVMGMLLAALAVTLVLTAMGEWLSLPKL